jgi:hypothetical protein
MESQKKKKKENQMNQKELEGMKKPRGGKEL